MPLRRLKKNPPPSLHERRRYARAQNSLAIKLEDKEQIKRRIGRSPDRADAVTMAWYAAQVLNERWFAL